MSSFFNVGGVSTEDIANSTDIANAQAGKLLDASVVIDEDDFSSDSATKLPTQQSVHSYVDRRDNYLDSLGNIRRGMQLRFIPGTARTISMDAGTFLDWNPVNHQSDTHPVNAQSILNFGYYLSDGTRPTLTGVADSSNTNIVVNAEREDESTGNIIAVTNARELAHRVFINPLTQDVQILLAQHEWNTSSEVVQKIGQENVVIPPQLAGYELIGALIVPQNSDNYETSNNSGILMASESGSQFVSGGALSVDAPSYKLVASDTERNALTNELVQGLSVGVVSSAENGNSYAEYRVISPGTTWALATKELIYPTSSNITETEIVATTGADYTKFGQVNVQGLDAHFTSRLKTTLFKQSGGSVNTTTFEFPDNMAFAIHNTSNNAVLSILWDNTRTPNGVIDIVGLGTSLNSTNGEYDLQPSAWALLEFQGNTLQISVTENPRVFQYNTLTDALSDTSNKPYNAIIMIGEGGGVWIKKVGNNNSFDNTDLTTWTKVDSANTLSADDVDLWTATETNIPLGALRKVLGSPIRIYGRIVDDSTADGGTSPAGTKWEDITAQLSEDITVVDLDARTDGGNYFATYGDQKTYVFKGDNTQSILFPTVGATNKNQSSIIQNKSTSVLTVDGKEIKPDSGAYVTSTGTERTVTVFGVPIIGETLEIGQSTFVFNAAGNIQGGATGVAYNTINYSFNIEKEGEYYLDCSCLQDVTLAGGGSTTPVGGSFFIGTTAGASDIATLQMGTVKIGFDDDNRDNQDVQTVSDKVKVNLTAGTYYYYMRTANPQSIGGSRQAHNLRGKLNWIGKNQGQEFVPKEDVLEVKQDWVQVNNHLSLQGSANTWVSSGDPVASMTGSDGDRVLIEYGSTSREEFVIVNGIGKGTRSGSSDVQSVRIIAGGQLQVASSNGGTGYAGMWVKPYDARVTLPESATLDPRLTVGDNLALAANNTIVKSTSNGQVRTFNLTSSFLNLSSEVFNNGDVIEITATGNPAPQTNVNVNVPFYQILAINGGTMPKGSQVTVMNNTTQYIMTDDFEQVSSALILPPRSTVILTSTGETNSGDFLPIRHSADTLANGTLSVLYEWTSLSTNGLQTKTLTGSGTLKNDDYSLVGYEVFILSGTGYLSSTHVGIANTAWITNTALTNVTSAGNIGVNFYAIGSSTRSKTIRLSAIYQKNVNVVSV